MLLRLIGMLQGVSTSQSPDQAVLSALDDALFADDVGRNAGAEAEAILAASAHLSGPDRLLDFAMRRGPYGDDYGRQPDGLNLAKVKAAPNGIDLGALQSGVPALLRTPSGKIELAAPSLLADLARLAGAMDQPVPELMIVGRRQVRSNNSWMHNLPVLAKGPFRCTALLHPEDAARHGVQNGASVELRTASGGITVEVELSDEMMPGVISLPHGWGHDLPGSQMQVASLRPGANLNTLLDENLRDPLSGNAVLSGIPVRMRVL
jgi:anaerobic selenocysteine-containing dehydrogenase